MYSTLIFFLALLYIVNASVITINVFDDDPETEVAHEQRDCNFRACEQLCRRLGFTGGACVNGRCKCDNFLTIEGEVRETAETISESEDSLSPKECNFGDCIRICFKHGFRYGNCVNGRCRCHNYHYAEDEVRETADTLSESEDSLSPKECNYRDCVRMCRKRGFPSGSCANGRCRCHNYHYAEGRISKATRNCDYKTCNQICQVLGYTDGVCVNSHCKCYSRSFLGDSPSTNNCDYQLCNHKCQSLGYSGGVCLNGNCKCNSRPVGEAVTETAESLSQRDCNLQACEQQCRRFGFPGGACANDLCKCDIFHTAEDSSVVNDTTSDKNEEPILAFRTKEDELILSSLGACDTALCNDMCRTLNYNAGLCSGGVCQCY